MLKNWCFWTVVLEKTLGSPLDCKGIKPVNPKGNQSWIFIGRTDPEADTPILWPPNVKSWVLGKYPDAGKDWRQEEKGTTEDKMVWMASLTWWTWIWVSSGSWWWTGKPGMLQCMGLQRVGHDWATWTELKFRSNVPSFISDNLSSLLLAKSVEIEICHIYRSFQSTNFGIYLVIFCSNLFYFLSSASLGLACSSFTSSLRWMVLLLILDLSSLLLFAFIAIIFVLSTALLYSNF